MTILSTPAEWHALGVGVLCGFVAGRFGHAGPLTAATTIALNPGDYPPGHRRDIQHESGYFAGGTLAGYLVGHITSTYR